MYTKGQLFEIFNYLKKTAIKIRYKKNICSKYQYFFSRRGGDRDSRQNNTTNVGNALENEQKDLTHVWVH